VKPFLTCRTIRGLLLCVTLLGPAVGWADTPAAAAEWTLLVYLDADNDLEKPMMHNLEEMLAVGSTDRVQIIVLAARSPESVGLYTDVAVGGLPDWNTTKLLRVERGRLRELADWGAAEVADMGDKKTLARFLATVTRDFPAKRYGLIFGDHGMAWAGIAVAESREDDALTIDEVAASLAAVQPATGRFEFVGFDACLMANLEVARTLAPYARYLVASEEIEPADGWDYQTLLERLTRAPAMDGAALGHVIVDTYRDAFAQSKLHEMQEKARAATLTVVDLDRMAAVDQAVTRLGSGIDSLLGRGQRDAWIRLAHARHEAEEFGRSAAPPKDGVSSGMEVYDLVQIAEQLKDKAGDPATTAAADAVIAAVRAAVRYDYHGPARPHANGLSVFFPPNQATLADRGRNTKRSYDRLDYSATPQNRWYPFLSRYAAFPAGPEERNRPKPMIEAPAASGRMASKDRHVKIHAQVHDDEVEEASFVLSRLENGEEIVMGAIPARVGAGGALDEEWDGAWFSITDQHLDFVAPITSFEELGDDGHEDLYWATVPAQLRIAGTRRWLDVTLNFVLDFSDESEDVGGDFIYAVLYTRHGPREVDLEEGDELRMVYEVIDASGNERLRPVEGDEHVMHLHDREDLKVERSHVPNGVYQVGFVVTDLDGKVSENFVAVQVE
jgi:hypothetical protein